jgi:hypothetical protein
MQFFRVRCNWNGKIMYKLKLSVGVEFKFVKILCIQMCLYDYRQRPVTCGYTKVTYCFGICVV